MLTLFIFSKPETHPGKKSLTQGRYTWRHNQVLKCLAATLETRRTSINAIPPPSHPIPAKGFVREGAKPSKTTTRKTSDLGLLGGARDWKLVVDLSLKYTELAADAEQHGWKAKVCPVEVACRGFVGKTTTRLLKDLGIRGQAQRQAIKVLSSTEEQGSWWLWLKR